MMFSEVDEKFAKITAEVELFIALVASSDNNELMIVRGQGPQSTPTGAPPSEWGIMLKATAYLVLYNLIEAVVRMGFKAVYETIKKDSICGNDLTAKLRKQWIEQRNRRIKPFDGSPKLYMEIADELISDIIDKKRVYLSTEHMPALGNYDASVIRHLCDIHGADSTPEPSTKGGVEITNVKKRRNDLSHGLLSFIEVGRDATASDLVKVKVEVITFLRHIIGHLKSFATQNKYKKT